MPTTITHNHSVPVCEHPDVPAAVALTRGAVRGVFAAALRQDDYVIGLHKLVYGDAWDQIACLDGYVKCSEEVSKFIFREAIAWDKSHSRNVVSGGAWMNWGWSALAMPPTGWEVIPAPVTWRVGLS